MKKKNMADKIWFLLILLLLITAISCVTKPRGKPVYTWTAQAEENEDSWFITLHPEVAPGVYPFTLGGPLFGSSRIKGYATEDGTGGWTLSVDTLHHFNTWSGGWTDADLLVLGSLNLVPSDGGWKLKVTEQPVIESVRKGTIRYKDKIIHGDDASKMITNRWYRLEAAAEYLRGRLPEPWYDYFHRKPKKGNCFVLPAGRLLFPEMYGYPEGKTASEKLPENRARGELLTWDTVWTGENFPEFMQEVRDAGTLYRDFEEASPLLYTLYQWPLFWKEKAEKLTFTAQ